jgi:dephospho-CoA kinase
LTALRVVLDIAILIGSRLGRDLPSGRRYDTVVVVDAPEALRVERLVRQRGMSETDARARIAAQPGDAERHAVADHVLVNAGDLATLDRAVDRLIDEL